MMLTRRHFTLAAIAAAIRPWDSVAKPLDDQTPDVLRNLPSPVLFAGDCDTAFRDPAAIYHDGWMYLFFTLLKREPDGKSYSYLAWTKSRDLQEWTPVIKLTPADKRKDFGSPGDVLRSENEWILCLQTYPRPYGETYANQDARIWLMRSRDLEHWSAPELLRVKGPSVSRRRMGRMIDPFLLHDRNPSGPWWCFYKQNGISLSRSEDLRTWTFVGSTDAGENPCVIVDGEDYVLFHSPPNGIGMKRSSDLQSWRDYGATTLGQAQWEWAAGRITAGFVLDLRQDRRFRRALLFFHGSRYPEGDARGGFDNQASIGLAWSEDLRHWEWPKSLR